MTNFLPRIETLEEKKLLGLKTLTSFAQDKTAELWRAFMSRKKEIGNATGTNLYSLQVYSANHNFSVFDPHVVFEKWALAEVSSFDHLPKGMTTFVLSGGLYAVFLYKGNMQGAADFFGYIFTKWLPQSGYTLDQRPHFEILGEKYKNGSPDSEEEIWIPIKPLP